jgi:hypothetical protein
VIETHIRDLRNEITELRTKEFSVRKDADVQMPLNMLADRR